MELAIAYLDLGLKCENNIITPDKYYMSILDKVNSLENYKNNRFMQDYYFRDFFADFSNEKHQFEEMLYMLENEDIHKVFMLCSFFRFDIYELGVLAKICKDRNIVLIFPYADIDNINDASLFDSYIESVGDLNVRF